MVIFISLNKLPQKLSEINVWNIYLARERERERGVASKPDRKGPSVKVNWSRWWWSLGLLSLSLLISTIIDRCHNIADKLDPTTTTTTTMTSRAEAEVNFIFFFSNIHILHSTITDCQTQSIEMLFRYWIHHIKISFFYSLCLFPGFIWKYLKCT